LGLKTCKILPTAQKSWNIGKPYFILGKILIVYLSMTSFFSLVFCRDILDILVLKTGAKNFAKTLK